MADVTDPVNEPVNEPENDWTPDPGTDPMIADLSADATGMSDAELRVILAQARAADDAAVHRLVTSYISLRRLAAELVGVIETREGGKTIEQTPLFRRVRELTRRTTG